MIQVFRNPLRIRPVLFQKASLWYASEKLLWFIVGFGIILRLNQYLSNRSLWLDEARLALNIVNRSFLELLQPLAYDQGAPAGFLMLQKLAVHAFGPSEYTLRLIPFVAGIISLFLFYKVAKKHIRFNVMPIALGLFAISDRLIYYSSEVKQYSSDVAVGLFLYLITIYVQSKKLTPGNVILFGMAGAIAIWISHPAVFVLASVGGSLMLFSVIRKEWLRIGQLSVAILFWAVSFAAAYYFSLRALSNNSALLTYWSNYNSFMPFPPVSFSAMRWLVDAFFKSFRNPLGLELSGIAAFLFLIGCVSMYSTKREWFVMFISPILLALLASGLHQYPFRGRLILFIVPVVTIIMAKGIEQFIEISKVYSLVPVSILIGLLFLHPLLDVRHYLVSPYAVEEIKPIISYVRSHQQDGDVLYLYYGAEEAFTYYQQRYGYEEEDYLLGVFSADEHWSDYASDLDKLQGHERVWVVFSHLSWRPNEEKFFLYYLDTMGAKLDSFNTKGAAVYLYDLSNKSAMNSK